MIKTASVGKSGLYGRNERFLRDRCEDYADRFGVEFHAGEKPWGRVKADVYMPCATQNEIGLEDAKRMIEEGTSKLLIEVANMPTKAEAVEELQKQDL